MARDAQGLCIVGGIVLTERARHDVISLPQTDAIPNQAATSGAIQYPTVPGRIGAFVPLIAAAAELCLFG